MVLPACDRLRGRTRALPTFRWLRSGARSCLVCTGECYASTTMRAIDRQADSVALADTEASIQGLLQSGDAALCLGFALGASTDRLPERACLLPGTWLIVANTAGGATLHRLALGVVARVPGASALARLAKSYHGSNLVGDWSAYEDWQTTSEEASSYAGRLRALGLDVSPDEARSLAEAWLPIGLDSAWAYVRKQALDVVTGVGLEVWQPDWQRFATMPKLDSHHALVPESSEDLRNCLEQAWAVLQPQLDSPIQRHGPARGILIVENSD